jgi:hypothetical protein
MMPPLMSPPVVAEPAGRPRAGRIDRRQPDCVRAGVIAAAGAGAFGAVLVAWVGGARGRDRPGEFETRQTRCSITLPRLQW